MEDIEKIIKILTEKKKTLATMESCSGGYVVNNFTNVLGASEVIKFSAVTYSNEFKIKMGVSHFTIDEFSVYSMETAKEMSKCISSFADSNYGVGITGKLNRVDKNNLFGEDNKVYISIYNKDSDKYYNSSIFVDKKTREENKKMILQEVVKMFLQIL